MQTDIEDRTDQPVPGPDPTGHPSWGLFGPPLRREAAKWWWIPLIAGISWLLIAWLVLRADVNSLATVGFLIGVAFIVAAANETVLAGFMHGGWKVAHYLLAVVFVLGSLWAFLRPVNTFFALASVLGLILFFQGTFLIFQGFALRDVSPHWGLQAFSGFMITALGIWVSVSDRVWDLRGRAVFILVFVGILALFRGISNLGLAFSMLGFGTSGQRRGTGEPAAGDVAPSIPEQERRTADGAARPGAPSGSRG